MSKVLRRIPGGRPLVFSSGKGNRIRDVSGKEYLDMASNAMVTNLGYGHEEVISVMVNQARELSYAHNGRYTNEPQERLAERLSNMLGGEYYVYFCGSGSEVIEASLRLAFLYQKHQGYSRRTRICSSEKSYHGATYASLSATGLARLREPFKDYLQPPLFFRSYNEFSYEQFLNPNSELREQLVEMLSREDVGGLLVESMSTNVMGAVAPEPGYLFDLQNIARSLGRVMILDEISTAIARVGKNFAFELGESFCPDMICLSKGLGVGYINMGAVLLHRDIAEIIQENECTVLGHSYNGTPIACATAECVLSILERDSFNESNASLGEFLIAGLKDIARESRLISHVSGRGLAVAIHFWDAGVVFPVSRQYSIEIYLQLLKEGLIVLPGSGAIDGFSGDHITITPPFITSFDDATIFLEKFEKLIRKIESRSTR